MRFQASLLAADEATGIFFVVVRRLECESSRALRPLPLCFGMHTDSRDCKTEPRGLNCRNCLVRLEFFMRGKGAESESSSFGNPRSRRILFTTSHSEKFFSGMPFPMSIRMVHAVEQARTL